MTAFPQQSIASCQMFPAVSIALGEVFCPADNVHAEDGGGRFSCCSAHRDETCALSVAHLRSPAHIHTVAGATRAPQLTADPRPGYSNPERLPSLGTRARTPTTAPRPLLLASHSLFPSLYSPDRPGLQGGSGAGLKAGVLAYSLQYLIPFLLPSARLPRNRLWMWSPFSRTSLFSFYALQVAFGFLVELGRKLPRGAGYASPDPGLGGLERKLAPPHGLSPLQHPCRLAGGQAASRLPALSSQPCPA